jgi:hypothetical protein
VDELADSAAVAGAPVPEKRCVYRPARSCCCICCCCKRCSAAAPLAERLYVPRCPPLRADASARSRSSNCSRCSRI